MKIFEFLKNDNGTFSSRRIAGFFAILIGIIGKLVFNFSDNLTIFFAGSGFGLLGLTTFDPETPKKEG